VDAGCPGERCEDAVLMDPTGNPSLNEVVKAIRSAAGDAASN